MTRAYSDPSRESDPHALPDLEIFHVGPGGWSAAELAGDYESEDTGELDPGFYWWYCFPGCLPDSEPIGPFDTYDAALADAREWE